MGFLPKKKIIKRIVKPAQVAAPVEYVEQPEQEQPDQLNQSTEPTVPELPSTWAVQDVPIQSERVIVNQKTNKAYDLHSAIAELLERTEQ